jgi:hypothetical protein
MSDVAKQLAGITRKPRQQIHTSFMDVLSRCEMQAMYIYLLGIRRPPRAFLHVGTGVHRSVELDLQSKIDTGELLKRNDAVEIAGAAFDQSAAKDPIELGPDEKEENKSVIQVMGESKDKTVALAGLHYDEAAPKLTPKLVEHSFSINMDSWLRKRAKELHAAGDAPGLDAGSAKMLHAEAAAMNSAARLGIDLAGKRDIVEEIDGEEIIRDTKTSGKSPNKDIVDDSDQLSTYSLASLVFNKKLPKGVALDYLVQTPKRHDLKYVPLTSTRNMDDINVLLFRFARSVHSWHTACKTGSFLPARSTDWWCSERFCAFTDRCPAFKRPKLVQIEAVAE